MSSNKVDGNLVPDRHSNEDFFVCNIMGANPKDDLGSMEHPLFSLSNGDKKIRKYSHNNCNVKVIPSVLGMATVKDKDILIYATSQLIGGSNQGRTPSRTIVFGAYDYLVSTNRPTGGDEYRRLRDALSRLKGTTIETNIPSGGKTIDHGFGLIEEWKIIKRKVSGKEIMESIEITLSDWLYRAILSKEVLTLNRDYFRLRKPLERRLYELARKHCGGQAKWMISLSLLQKKCGSVSQIKKFRYSVKSIAEKDCLPDYHIGYNPERDAVMFYTRDKKRLIRSIL